MTAYGSSSGGGLSAATASAHGMQNGECGNKSPKSVAQFGTSPPLSSSPNIQQPPASWINKIRLAQQPCDRSLLALQIPWANQISIRLSETVGNPAPPLSPSPGRARADDDISFDRRGYRSRTRRSSVAMTSLSLHLEVTGQRQATNSLLTVMISSAAAKSSSGNKAEYAERKPPARLTRWLLITVPCRAYPETVEMVTHVPTLIKE